MIVNSQVNVSRPEQYERSVISLAKPDNGADMELALRVSGNRLVSVLNTLDSLLYETGRLKLSGNDTIASDPHVKELRDFCETLRDEMSAQRNQCTAESVYADRARIARICVANAA